MFSSVQREAHFRGLQTFKKFILVPYISVILKVSGHRYNFINSRRTHRIYAATACQVASVVSDSVRPHGLQPTRLLRPWDSPGKNTGVGCHFLLQCMKVESESEVAQSCPTVSDPMDCSLPASSIHGIFRATVLEWGAIAFSQRIYIVLQNSIYNFKSLFSNI